MSYFVKLGDSNEVRRNILEGGKEIIEGLKGYELLLDLRDQKKEVIQDVQKVMADLQALLKKLEETFPTKSLKELDQYLPRPERSEPEKKKESKTSAKENKVAKPKASPMSEAQKLNKALQLIEERLQELK